MSLYNYLKDAAKELSDLFLPASCACCAAYGKLLAGHKVFCPPCWQAITRRLTTVGRAPLRFADPPTFFAAHYEAELARAILSYKNAGRTDLVPYFARWMLPALERCLAQFLGQDDYCPATLPRIYLVPVPSSRVSVRRRGFAPAHLLASALAGQLRRRGYTCSVLPALEQKRDFFFRAGQQQKTLGAKERYVRMRHRLLLAGPPLACLGFSYELAGRYCLLIDDVATTGASLNAAARVLNAAGSRLVGACTLAAVAAPGKNDTSWEIP